MKKLLVGLLALGSISSTYASNCYEEYSNLGQAVNCALKERTDIKDARYSFTTADYNMNNFETGKEYSFSCNSIRYVGGPAGSNGFPHGDPAVQLALMEKSNSEDYNYRISLTKIAANQFKITGDSKFVKNYSLLDGQLLGHFFGNQYASFRAISQNHIILESSVKDLNPYAGLIPGREPVRELPKQIKAVSVPNESLYGVMEYGVCEAI